MSVVGIDARLINQTGVGTYIRNLILEIADIRPSDLRFCVFVRAQDRHLVPASSHIDVCETEVMWHSIAEQTQLLYQIMAQKLDLVHFTYFGYPALYPGKYVSTIHDLTPLHHRTGRASTHAPWRYQLKYQAFCAVLAQQARRSRAVITPTDAVRDQLLSTYPSLFSYRVHTIYEGYDRTIQEAECVDLESIDPSLEGGSYLLYVGNCYPHKRVDLLINEWSRNPNLPQLVVAGPSGEFFERMRSKWGAQKDKSDGRVLFVEAPSKSTLKTLYHHSRALVHPSSSEGFGLPVLEAMEAGIPLILSDIPVFREIAGSAALYFDPEKPDSLAESIRRIDTKEKRMVRLERYAPLLGRFSFRDMAEKTIALYRSALTS